VTSANTGVGSGNELSKGRSRKNLLVPPSMDIFSAMTFDGQPLFFLADISFDGVR
jgi:hypothetical protein